MTEFKHPANIEHYDKTAFGDKLADSITSGMGSWRFINIQAVITVLWIILNSIHGWAHWDSYPFILLNLVYSFQAGFTGPILLLSQNRQMAHDRTVAEHTEKTSTKSLAIHTKIAEHLGVDISDVE
jgi:uncharacterized membrane protein